MISCVFNVGSLLVGLSLALGLLSAPAMAVADNFLIEDIRIEGLQRVSAGLVFSLLSVDVGDAASNAALRESLHRLFASGNFDDAQLLRDGGVLVVRLAERPFVINLQLDGNRAVPTEALEQALDSAGIRTGEVLKRATLKNLREELLRQYSKRGFYHADVVIALESLPRNRVAIDIEIKEGKAAKIRRIELFGNKRFSHRQLLRKFDSRVASALTWFGKKHLYSRDTLSADLDKLATYYRNRGHLDFAIESAQVSVTPNRRGVYIDIRIAEGERYRVSEVSLAGELIVPRAQLAAHLGIAPGDSYQELAVTETERKMAAVLGNLGYLDARVRGLSTRDPERPEVAITFLVEPGRQKHVRRIEVSGNKKTSDEVVRRELRVVEGGPAAQEAMAESRKHLRRLPFFREVEISTEPVPDIDGQVDVLVDVEEEFSGSIGLGVGYNSAYGLLYNLNFGQRNFFGSGATIDVQLDKSRYALVSNVAISQPYFTPNGISRSLRFYYVDQNLDEINVSRYTSVSRGAELGFSYPITDSDRLSLSLGFTETQLLTGAAAVREIRSSPQFYRNIAATPIWDPAANDGTGNLREDLDAANLRAPHIPGFLDRHGDRYQDLSLSLGWSQYRLDRGQLASRGYAQSLVFESTVPLSDLSYYRLRYNGEYIQPLNDWISLRLRTEFGYGDSYKNNAHLPFYRHFYAGGLNSVRGFDFNALGPRGTPAQRYQVQARDTDNDGIADTNYYVLNNAQNQLATEQVIASDTPAPFGGNTLIEGSIEVLFPLPFARDQRSVRGGVFFDFGNVFDTECRITQALCSDVDLGELRYSLGFGFTWITAVGPLVFSISRAFNKGPHEGTEVFGFSVGRAFGL